LKNTRYDLQDPTVPASAPQQQFGAILNGFTIVIIEAENEAGAKVAVENYFQFNGHYGRMAAWIEAGAKVALVSERKPEERWSA
jgi:hypothetical protein